MDTLLHALIPPSLLPFLKSGGHKEMDKDACIVLIRFVLLQKHPENTVKNIESWTELIIIIKQWDNNTQREFLATGSVSYFPDDNLTLNDWKSELATKHLSEYKASPNKLEDSHAGTFAFQNLNLTSSFVLN